MPGNRQEITVRASLAGTCIQTPPELVTPLKGARSKSPRRLFTNTVSAVPKVWVLITLWKQHGVGIPSLISLTVSVDVKHRVYLLTYTHVNTKRIRPGCKRSSVQIKTVRPSGKALGW